jgi:hypothetical protein
MQKAATCTDPFQSRNFLDFACASAKLAKVNARQKIETLDGARNGENAEGGEIASKPLKKTA